MAWIVVNGEVARTFYNGKGVAVKETFQKQDGTEGSAYYTAWFEEDPGLSEGDRGKFSGFHSAKVETYDDRDGNTQTKAAVSLNSARFEAEDAPADTPF